MTTHLRTWLDPTTHQLCVHPVGSKTTVREPGDVIDPGAVKRLARMAGVVGEVEIVVVERPKVTL